MKLKESFIACSICEKMTKVSEVDNHMYLHLQSMRFQWSRITWINVPKTRKVVNRK